MSDYFPMPEGDPCFFCEIVASNDHQWLIVDDAEQTMTLLNGRQFEIGQCVVIPKRHVPSLLDLDAAEAAAVMAAAQKVAKVLVDAYSPDGVLLYQNNGTGSGQEVPHFHLHVVPRQPGSDWGFGPPHLERLEREGRNKHDDYKVVTDEKVRTVEVLRSQL